MACLGHSRDNQRRAVGRRNRAFPASNSRTTRDRGARARHSLSRGARKREIAAALALLRGLASSPALRSGDLKADQLLATEVPE